MPINFADTQLPIVDVFDQVKSTLSTTNSLVLSAPPGAGKSTLLPLALMDEPWLKGQKIIMLEPRRLAARTIAERLADLLGEKVGERVGYRIRFDTRVGDKTQIEVVTEGILTRMLHGDNALEGIGLIIFDEFHERSIHADVALALSRETQAVLREDLRIMIMSATLDMNKLTHLLNAPAVVSKGRQYPVDVHYVDCSDIFLLPELVSKTVEDAVNKHDGDVLVFLPGQGEIMKCAELLKRLRAFEIHPLYGQLPQNKQFAAIRPSKSGKRKIVLATSIAETSLTIEGVKIVVDSGFGRTQKFDPKSGLSRLETIQISKDNADQRAGRAGRLSPGVCYRMWSKGTHAQLSDHLVPEILDADLTSLALDMAHWGITDITKMTWLSPPPQHAVVQANETLALIEATEDGKITPHGKRVHEVPCHPRIAHMLINAQEEGLLPLATDLAAILEERDPLPRESGIDINLRIEALRRHRSGDHQTKKFRFIEKVAESYRTTFKIEEENKPVDPFETGLLLAFAYPERIAYARPGNNAQFQLANGRYAMAGHKDDLAYEAWLAIAHLDARDGMGKIFLASPLNPKDLAHMVKERETIKWDSKNGGIHASTDLCIGNIVLRSTPIQDIDEELKSRAICDAVKKEGRSLLPFDQVTQWQNRILSLRKWNPDENWPDVSTKHLLDTCHKWLSPYLSDVKKPEDLKKLNLGEMLQFNLPFEKQQLLATLAPLKIKVPSGNNITLKYSELGAQPVLAVRIQELFGMANTPSINNGKTTMLLHLLSPGFKPVQVTSDLESFWSSTYFEVKKELKRRYPKHKWPDDPNAI